MWLKSHKWIAEPHFKTERKHILDTVRESHHTAMVFDRRYFDVESGKFVRDKLHSIKGFSLGDIQEEDQWSWNYTPYRDSNKKVKPINSKAWFTPKDDDFDEECSRDSRKAIKREVRKEVKVVKVVEFQPHVAEIKRQLEEKRLEKEYEEREKIFLENKRRAEADLRKSIEENLERMRLRKEELDQELADIERKKKHREYELEQHAIRRENAMRNRSAGMAYVINQGCYWGKK